MLIIIGTLWKTKLLRVQVPQQPNQRQGTFSSGPLSNSNHSENLNTSILNVLTEHDQEQFDLERFWRIESVGVQPNSLEEVRLTFLSIIKTRLSCWRMAGTVQSCHGEKNIPLYHQMQKSLSREPAS